MTTLESPKFICYILQQKHGGNLLVILIGFFVSPLFYDFIMHSG